MNEEVRRKLAALGTQLSPELVMETNALFAALAGPIPGDAQVTRDLAYGPDERHRLDIFVPPGASGAGVLVFVHGGGFVMGTKSRPDSPFYDNVAAFAARHGMIGVIMNYRLAPAHRWPAGTDDVALAVDWLRANVGRYGGDPERIYLAGQSAGAVHVASYVALRKARIAGAIMISGIYNTVTADHDQFHLAYYGDDAAIDAQADCTAGLIASEVPLLHTVSEFDPPDFQRQIAAFADVWTKAKGGLPRLVHLRGHNHQSPAVSIGSSADSVGPEILTFIADTMPRGD